MYAGSASSLDCFVEDGLEESGSGFDGFVLGVGTGWDSRSHAFNTSSFVPCIKSDSSIELVESDSKEFNSDTKSWHCLRNIAVFRTFSARIRGRKNKEAIAMKNTRKIAAANNWDGSPKLPSLPPFSAFVSMASMVIFGTWIGGTSTAETLIVTSCVSVPLPTPYRAARSPPFRSLLNNPVEIDLYENWI